MTNSAQRKGWALNLSSWPATAALATAIVFALMAIAAQSAHAQTFTVIHTFTGGSDGSNPTTGLSLDKAGNLYGGTALGGISNQYCAPATCGMAFKMIRKGSSWLYYPLYLYTGKDGFASAPFTFAPDGSIYSIGGTYAYHLRPPATRCASFLCEWTDNVIWTFCCGIYSPGGLSFDSAGNLYGASEIFGKMNRCSGGLGCGYVFQFAPVNGGWTQNVLYEFSGYDGSHPTGGVIPDQMGNLYGTTAGITQGDGNGNVFELTPSGSGYWNETVLYAFTAGADGKYPEAGVIFDPDGNLYGATSVGGANRGGTIFELSPSNGGWTFKLLYSLYGTSLYPTGVLSSLVRDSAGNLYGMTNANGAYNLGNMFKLSPGSGGWTYTSLHEFTGGSDGANPRGSLILDSNGNLYGTTFAGGNSASSCSVNANYQCGVVFEITP